MSGRLYLSPPEVTGPDRDRLLEAVDSNWIAPTGPDLDAFESEVAARCSRTHGVALASGTAGLHLALRELGVGPGDDVLLPSMTFVATANAVRYCGATPVLIDADRTTWQMSPELLADAIADRRAQGARVAAAISVDLYGQCSDYDSIREVLEPAGVPLLEDAAEALGARYRDRPAGSFGTAAILSFNGNKIITTSGGGMVVTDDEHLARRIRHLASQAREPAPHYEHSEIGFNYRLSNLLAAFGRGQLSDLDERIKRRSAINARYRDGFAGVAAISPMPIASYGVPNHWLTCITIAPDVDVHPSDIVAALESADIESRPLWKPMHLQPLYQSAPSYLNGTTTGLFDRGLCLPSGGAMTVDRQTEVIDIVRSMCR